MSRKLQGLIDEAKKEEPRAVRDLDWSKIESAVMSEVAKDASARPRRSPDWRKKYLRPATIALAVAATAIIYVRREAARQPTAEHTTQHAQKVLAQREEASALTSGELRIDDALGASLPAGHVVRTGDALSVTNGRAMLERGKAVWWLLEKDDAEAARARVSAAGAMEPGNGPSKPLVLDLEHGAIEAQVTPVKEGEAFAVDVITKTGIVRVAVHGTHLRVARAGDRVVVDLTEGVIAIGTAPTSGRTTGTTVTAPAHVELDANDLGTLEVRHTDVRAPIELGGHVVAPAPAPAPTHASIDETAHAAPPPSMPKTPSRVEAPKPEISPRDAIVDAVRQCSVQHAKSGGEVRVSVTSSLELTIGPEGAPTLAKFTPPLQPEVQTCAAETIYKTKFATADREAGSVSIPISFSY